MSSKYDLPSPTADIPSALVVDGIQNPGLLLQAFVPNLRVGDKTQKARARGEHLGRLAAMRFPTSGSLWDAWSTERHNLYVDLHAEAVYFRLDSDYTHGLALPTPLDNGFTLLPPLGIPPIPAETIRGVMHEWLVTCLTGKLAWRRSEDGKTSGAGTGDPLKHTPWAGLFPEPGSDGESARSKVTFYDAWPAFHLGEVRFRVIGTTPHHKSWYEDERGVPDGNENPQPVAHLSVRRGSPYEVAFLVDSGYSLSLDPTEAMNARLNVALKPQPGSNHAFGPDGTLARFGIAWDATDATTFVRSLLVSTATYCGFGSGTNVGRGLLVEVPASPAATAASTPPA